MGEPARAARREVGAFFPVPPRAVGDEICALCEAAWARHTDRSARAHADELNLRRDLALKINAALEALSAIGASGMVYVDDVPDGMVASLAAVGGVEVTGDSHEIGKEHDVAEFKRGGFTLIFNGIFRDEPVVTP